MLKRSRPARRASIAAACFLLSLFVAACGRGSVSRLSPPTLPTRVASTARTPGPATLADSAVIAQAYRLLLDRLVVPVSSTTLLSAAWDAAIAESNQEHVSGRVPNFVPAADGDANLESFQRAYAGLLDAGAGRLDQAKVEKVALIAMAESVNDCHTAFLTHDQMVSIDEELEGAGSVATLPIDFQLGQPYLITAVSHGSDADRAGVQPGDRIISFDGISLDSIPLSQRKFLSSGGVGSTVNLQIQLPDGGRRDVTVRREMVQQPVVEWHLNGNVAYVRVRTFSDNLNSLVDGALNDARTEGAQGFVLDLRGNLGGELGSDVHLLSHFVASGVLAETALRGRQPRPVSTDGSLLPDSPPLAVLVDSGSLSASELFAEDIKQTHAGVLVGTPTPGCLLGSSFRSLSDGSELQISEQNVLAGPQEVLVNGKGVQPDVVVPISAADLAAGRDPQLDRATSDVRDRIGL